MRSGKIKRQARNAITLGLVTTQTRPQTHTSLLCPDLKRTRQAKTVLNSRVNNSSGSGSRLKLQRSPPPHHGPRSRQLLLRSPGFYTEIWQYDGSSHLCKVLDMFHLFPSALYFLFFFICICCSFTFCTYPLHIVLLDWNIRFILTFLSIQGSGRLENVFPKHPLAWFFWDLKMHTNQTQWI